MAGQTQNMFGLEKYVLGLSRLSEGPPTLKLLFEIALDEDSASESKFQCHSDDIGLRVASSELYHDQKYRMRSLHVFGLHLTNY